MGKYKLSTSKKIIGRRATPKSWQRRIFTKRFLKPMAIVFIFASVGSAALSYARAATPPPTGMITGIASKCVDVRNNEHYNGNTVWLWTCHGGAAQQWTMQSDNTIRNQNWCLDVQWGAKTARTPVWLWTCDAGPAQIWIPQSNGTLKNPNSGLCLDDQWGATADGNPLWIWPCDGGAAQVWNVPKAAVPPPVSVQKNIPSVDTAVSSFMSKYGVPGVSIAVTRQDKLVYAQSYGVNGGGDNTPVTNKSQYRLASASKSITSAAIYKFIEAGQLSLTTPVFGPNGVLKAEYPNAPAIDNTITIQNLLTHTTGVWGNDANDPMFQHMDYSQKQLITWALNTYPADHNRGNFAYSNFGYSVLGRVIEKLSGMTYENYTKTYVLGPMGIADMKIGGSTLAQRKPGEVVYTGQNGATPYGPTINVPRMDSHGGWIGSATDMARFIAHIDGNSGVADSLKPATIASMVKPTTGNPNYASGWYVNASNNWWHSGALPGTATQIVRSSNGFNWVIYANSYSYASDFGGALDQLLWPAVNNSATPWQNIDQF